MSRPARIGIAGVVMFTLLAGTDPLSAAPPRSAPLVDAAKSGDHATVEALLKSDPTSVHQVGPDGTTALHWAVNRDDAALVELLIGARADVAMPNRYGFPPISFAAVNGSAVVLTHLIAAGADPNTLLPGGETPLMTAARTGDPEAIQVLLAAGARVNTTDAQGQSALMWAAAANNPGAVAALVARGADLNLRTEAGLDALMFAVRGGRVAATEGLIAAGADVNGTLTTGETVLEVALVNSQWSLADTLLDHGADPNHSDAGYTALHRLTVLRPIVAGLVFSANIEIPIGSVDIILDLVKKMIAKGVDVNARMSKDALKEQRFLNNRDVLVHVGATAFLLAAKEADLELMDTLLAAGADPTIPTFDGTTPLMVASGLYTYRGSYRRFKERGKVADILASVRMCRDLGNDVNAVNSAGDTALHGAAYRGAPEVAEYLIANGSKLDVVDSRGLSPLAVASGVYYITGLLKSPETADALRQTMQDRGLPTAVPPVDEKNCLYCYLTNRRQYRSSLERVRELEELFAKQQNTSVSGF